jgi:hypothetical protein
MGVAFIERRLSLLILVIIFYMKIADSVLLGDHTPPNTAKFENFAGSA